MKIFLNLDPDLELELRRRALYKGDLSKIANAALREYFNNHERANLDDFVKAQ